MKIQISEKQLSMIAEKYQELGEEADGASSGTSEPEGSTTAGSKKWESGASRGKANPLQSSGPWESGVTRGKANPLF